MFTITDAADLHFIFSSISDGSAVALSDHNFSDTDYTGAEYSISFYALADAVFRLSYNDRWAQTTVYEVTGQDAKDRLLAEKAG
jgi:hypothetical protein